MKASLFTALLLSLACLPSRTSAEDASATPAGRLIVKDGFSVELLLSVPKETLGSWVAITRDDKQRFIVSDQYGSLYRFPIPAAGKTVDPATIEKIDLDIGQSQGLLHANKSLYLTINTNDHGGRGFYRLRDTDGDDKYDEKTLLKKFEEQGGEHGPHSVILGPDGQSIYVICGNQTAVPDGAASRVPPFWKEDNLLPRVYGRGFMKGILAPRGWIARTDFDGKSWELIATGFRNPYDLAFDKHGELFTYDADMEWDMNTPWYRPTRINHVVSGAEYGWRNGSAKWPAHYIDSVGAVVDIGPGSPTGIAFGTGAKFPPYYQDALFICDWSYGKLYAVHLSQKGASYEGSFEEFISGSPLPLTDILVNPDDGALYFTVGGRKVQSGLYRVTHTGKEAGEPPAPAPSSETVAAQEQRHKLEALHSSQHPDAVATAWPFLSHHDRSLRYAAQVAIEHQPVAAWKDKALTETDPRAGIAALACLARAGTGAVSLAEVIDRLTSIDYSALGASDKLDFLRATGLALLRLGDHPGQQLDGENVGKEKKDKDTDKLAPFIANMEGHKGAWKDKLTAYLDKIFPAATREENTELSHLLVYLQAPSAASKLTSLLKSAPTQEEQISYAVDLRLLTSGWTPETRKAYFEWFVRAQTYRGGASFVNFVEEIKADAVTRLPVDQKQAMQALIDAKAPARGPQFTAEPRPFMKNYTVADFNDVIHVGLEGNRNYENGRKMFAAAACFACHRFNQEGGAIGPDLTSVAGKFGPNDLLESIIDPGKEISDQYGAMEFVKKDGTSVIGRIMNLKEDTVMVNTDMLDPDGATVNINRKDLVEMKPSPVSMMPPGLLNTLSKDDVLDLLAYLLSKGNPKDPMFAH
jgi:putative heme-binding domain-containing protein